jgi:signal recognition particle subunit SRP54
VFRDLQDRLEGVLGSLKGTKVLSDEAVKAVTRDVRRALLEADVALPVVRDLVTRLEARLVGTPASRALDVREQVVKAVDAELVRVLGEHSRELDLTHDPAVLMLVGLQGAGKTTFAAKLAKRLSQEGKRPLLVAADLQRPGAVAQLRLNGERAGVPVHTPEPGDDVGDPVAVAASARAAARSGGFDMVVLDTAGRLGLDDEMMEQARLVRDACEPDEVLFVLDAMVGQDAVAVAGAFESGVGLTGVVLTKLDGDTRGGAALSVAGVTGRTVLYASTGEGLDDLEVFHPERVASRILGMGDVLSLAEAAEKAFDHSDVERVSSKLSAGGDLTLEDFLGQVRAIRKMGSLSKVLGMLPGAGGLREQLDALDEGALDRVEAVVGSMTPGERGGADVLDRSRRTRVARGAGVEVKEVDDLLTRFEDSQRMMRGLLGGPAAGRGAPSSTRTPTRSSSSRKRPKKPKKTHRKKR